MHHGDPSSLFLFAIVGEALNKMVSRASASSLVNGSKPALKASSINHLQFANETIILCNANEDQIQNVKAILICFESVSGLKVIFF